MHPGVLAHGPGLHQTKCSAEAPNTGPAAAADAEHLKREVHRSVLGKQHQVKGCSNANKKSKATHRVSTSAGERKQREAEFKAGRDSGKMKSQR